MKYNDCVNKLRKHKDLKFICKTTDSLVRMSLNKDGLVAFKDINNGVEIIIKEPFPVWELEKEPVSFIEAINSKKEISSLEDEENGYLTLKDWLWELYNSYSCSQIIEMINGKWFIK